MTAIIPVIGRFLAACEVLNAAYFVLGDTFAHFGPWSDFRTA
jgi:hypothetical protein